MTQWDVSMSAKGTGCCHCEAILLSLKGHDDWRRFLRTGIKKCHFYLQDRQGGFEELQADQPHLLIPGKVIKQIYSQVMPDQLDNLL